MASKRPLDLETQLKDIRRQLNDQLGCLEFRMESKLSLLQEYQEFFKRRGEVEYEYARSLERLCEKFERNTKQRNIRTEVRSTFNLWSTLLAETRKMSRERASLAEVMASEMVSRLEIMGKDVQVLTKKCKEMCVEVQDQFLKELRDLSEQTKVYHHSCHNTNEAYNKLTKSREKLEATKGTGRRKKAMEKDMERQRQFKAQKHLLLKNRNEYLLGISRCNALSMQYFNMDIMDLIEYMDFDYHNSYRRLMCALREGEYETCEAVKTSADALVDQVKTLNFEGDLHYFLSEYANPFTPPNTFQFVPFQGDDVQEYKVNTEDVFKRAKKSVQDLREEVQTLQIQREEDVKTIQHMQSVNLKKYQVTTVDDALAVIEENGDNLPGENSGRNNASLERGLSLATRGGHALQLSQKGKKDTLFFTLGIVQRRVHRADRLCLASAQLDILEKSLDEQKVPPVPVGVDAQGRQIPGEVPKLFGGDIDEYIMATGSDVPLIVKSCIKAIEQNGMTMEGLFRVPGPAAYTDELRKGFEEGRDPLAYAQDKPDICAIASTLKAYFRELSTPLFPTEKYREFINCTKHDDMQERLDSIYRTVSVLKPTVVGVMKYLFRFLSRVAQFSIDNKMGTANLALVFGPTLMRAPDAIDPRQLHTDVPSVNILIQLCIEQNVYIFGDEEEEEADTNEVNKRIEQQKRSKSPPTLAPEPPSSELEASFELTSRVTVLSTSPPSEPPTAPPSSFVPPPQPIKEKSPEPKPDEEGESPALPPPPLPPRTSVILEGDILIPPDDEPPPPRPPKAVDKEPTPPPPQEESQKEATPEESSSPPAETNTEPATQAPEASGPMVDDFSDLDKAMEEINDSLIEMDVEQTKPETPASADDDGSDDESDSDEEEVVMKMDAHALYDYTSRSTKELSFKKGDIIQVIEKTPDNNWWDGFHESKRGFIPVSYIEILELDEQTSLPVPTPPQRRSSMPADSPSDQPVPPRRASDAPAEPSIPEEKEVDSIPFNGESRQMKTPELVIESPVDSKPPSQAVSVPGPTVPVNVPTPSIPEAETVTQSKEDKSSADVSRVRSLSKQFQDSPQQQKVLVEPHTTSAHRRQRSADITSQQKSLETDNIPPRSSSTSNKVGKITSVFETKSAPAPIAPKPKPRSHAPHPPTASPSHSSSFSPTEHHSHPPTFPLMAHPQAGGSGLPVSPLQRIAHQGQQKPVPADHIKKPPPPKGKGSVKVKRDKSFKAEKPAKPPPPAKPGYVAPSNRELNAELAARAARKHESK